MLGCATSDYPQSGACTSHCPRRTATPTAAVLSKAAAFPRVFQKQVQARHEKTTERGKEREREREREKEEKGKRKEEKEKEKFFFKIESERERGSV